MEIIETFPIYCANTSCIVPVRTPDGFALTSNIPGNDSVLTVTPAELADFLTDVRGGKHDALIQAARDAEAILANV